MRMQVYVWVLEFVCTHVCACVVCVCGCGCVCVCVCVCVCMCVHVWCEHVCVWDSISCIKHVITQQLCLPKHRSKQPAWRLVWQTVWRRDAACPPALSWRLGRTIATTWRLLHTPLWSTQDYDYATGKDILSANPKIFQNIIFHLHSQYL